MCRLCKHEAQKVRSDLLDAKWLTPRRENFTRNKNNYRTSDAAAVAQTANKCRYFMCIPEDSNWEEAAGTAIGLREDGVCESEIWKSTHEFVYPT